MSFIQTVPLGGSIDEASRRIAGRQLLVAGPSLFVTYPLPKIGSLEIGRSETAQLRIDDPSASRKHATLHVGDDVTVEDHGSINGTFVRGARLAVGDRVRVEPGDAIQIGATLLVLQQRPAPLQMVRVWPHVYFEGRVEDECRRAQQGALPFCILRVVVDTTVSAETLTATLAPVLTWTDALAAYAPGEWEILLAVRPEEALEGAIEATVAALEAGDIEAEVVTARYPEDGRNVDALLSVVQDRMHRGSERAHTRDLVVAEPSMRTLHDLTKRAAASDISVLILGETGVGKDVLARVLHESSPRADKAYLSINCAALSEALLESELFGHERGAFTGAVAAKAGLLESAPGGTVFLDEVGEMSPTLQAKLLRVIENREIIRVGSVQARPIDVRFVAATNRDLEAEVEAGRFRRDLYFRLAGITLAIPPLRERPGEIHELAMRFVVEACRRTDRRPVPTISPEAAELLRTWHWPGNIRELRNVMERALVLCVGAEIQTAHLPTDKMRNVAQLSTTLSGRAGGAAAVAEERARAGDDERARILDALAQHGGNQTRAARALGIPRRTFLRRLEAFGIVRPQKS